MPLDHEKYMRMAIEEAARGGAEGNLAVGSVVVRDDAVVAVGRNLVTSTNDPTAHAETVALREAADPVGAAELIEGFRLGNLARIPREIEADPASW